MKKASKRRMSRRTSDVLAPLLSLLEKDEVTRKKLSDLSIVEGNEMQSNANLTDNVWVFDRPNGEWVLATYAESGSTRQLGSTISVIIPKSSLNPDEIVREVPIEDVHEFDSSHMKDFDDAAKINNLHEAPLLFVLLRRYNDRKIYTNCSDVLISVNPYRHIDGLYGEEVMEMVATSKNPSPHVYCIAHNAYTTMVKQNAGGEGSLRSTKRNQSVIISGESGAGKTEASKHVMRYLIRASRVQAEKEGLSNVEDTAGIEKSIMQSNVILEAFGNAKTVRNDNSSRFGKYIKLRYDDNSHLKGAFTEHFLLEKSRLLQADRGERNYHVFYQLCKGLPEELKSELFLEKSEKYRMLTNGRCVDVDGVDDKEEFALLDGALETIGLTMEERKSLYQSLAGLLHLGNVNFVDNGENEMIDFTLGEGLTGDALSKLFKLDFDVIKTSLSVRHSRSGRGSYVTINMSAQQAKENLHALIKHIYGSLFSWLVQKINVNSGYTKESASQSRDFIGILDIFGFEIMQHNSLSQLCINFANEKLQQQFNHQVFVLEKELYAKEGLETNVISFKDNQPVIDLICKRPNGILCLLEEHSLLSREIVTSQLINAFEKPHLNVHENYVKSRFGNEDFIIRHFAGDVEYSGNELISKNNDSLQEDLLRMLKGSSSLFLRNTCTTESGTVGEPGYIDVIEDFAPGNDEESDVSKMAATNTVTSVFRDQLNKLVNTLHSTEPHYIKCVKPNGSKTPGLANGALVLEQLRYSGVLEVVRIRREGFPIRLPFVEFHKRYEILCFGENFPNSRKASLSESIAACEFICNKALMSETDEFAKGKTMIFLRNGVQEKLMMQVRAIYAGMATKIQSRQRAKVEKDKLQDIKKKTVLLQNIHRMIQKKSEFKRQQQATLKAQTFLRGRTEHKNFVRKKAAAEKIESIVRGHQASDGYKKTKASIKLQARVRSKNAEKELHKSKQAAVAMQAIARRRIGKDGYDNKKKMVTTLQAGVRRHEAREQFKTQKKSAIEAQNLYRMHQRRNSLLNKKAAVTKLQSVARVKQTEKEYQKQQDAALLLHNNVRRFLARAKLEHKKLGLFSGKKRRNNSVLYRELGDYIEAREDANLSRLIAEINPDEDEHPEILFADNVEKYNRKGKKQERKIVLTKGFLYILAEGNAVKSMISLSNGSLEKTSLSSMADDFVVLHLKDDRDLVLTCPHKTELVNTCSKIVQTKCGKELPMVCADMFTFKTWGSGFSRLKGLSEITFHFIEDEEVDIDHKWKLSVSVDKFDVRVSPTLGSLAHQQLGTPRAQRFNIMKGGKAREQSLKNLKAGGGSSKSLN